MMHVDPAVLLRSIDVLAESHRAAAESHRAALAAIEVLRSMVAGSIHQTACNENVGATVQAVAPAVAFVAPIAAASKAAKSNTEKSHKRRAELNKLGLPANYRGSLKAARAAAAQGATSATPEKVAPTVSPVAPDSSDSSFSLMSQDNDDGDENARARRCNYFSEKVAPEVSPGASASASDTVLNFRVTADQVESLTADVHGIVQERTRFPHQMLASTTVGYINELLKNGVSPRTIREAVHWAAPMAKAPIKTFWYFARPDGAIATAHADAMRAAEIAQPTLPLPATPQQGGQHGRPVQSSARAPGRWPGRSPAELTRERAEQSRAARDSN
jgi:hypothetical protein